MSNDQPVGNVVPPGRSVAMRMARTANVSSARRCQRLMAHSGAVIEECAALDGEEFPRVAAFEQRQLEQSVGVAVPLFAVRRDGAEEVMAIAPSSDDEFPNTVRWIRLAIRRLVREPLIEMLMPIEDNFRAGLIQRLPQRPQIHFAAVIS